MVKAYEEFFDFGPNIGQKIKVEYIINVFEDASKEIIMGTIERISEENIVIENQHNKEMRLVAGRDFEKQLTVYYKGRGGEVVDIEEKTK